MSANICWRAVKNDKTLDVPAPSSFQEKMSAVGMCLPCTIKQSSREILRGMAEGYGREKDRPNPFDQILELLDKYDEIELWAVY